MVTVSDVQKAMDSASAHLRKQLDSAESQLAMRLAMSSYELTMRTLVHMVIAELRNEHTDRLLAENDMWAKRCVSIIDEVVAIRDKPCT